MSMANSPTQVLESLPAGVGGVDDLLGGLMPGDNVVWGSDDPSLFEIVERGLAASAERHRLRCVYVTFGRPPAQVQRTLGAPAQVVDARPRGKVADAAALEQTVVAAAREAVPLCVVFDGLDRAASRWGEARAAAFFSRVCPRLFDLDAIAYWRAPRPATSRGLLERVTRVTQCVLELRGDTLKVVKAEGRSALAQGRVVRATLNDGDLSVEAERATGRLARGLEHVRQTRHLSQSDLARLAGVTASAISQAEAGRRGLSLDTLLVLAERLGCTVDDLLASAEPAGYVLARRERAGRHAQLTPLLDDPRAGLRAYLVRLPPGSSGQPPRQHKGPELVVVASGLVQLEVGNDSPVLRTGDAALVTEVAMSAWRNLTGEPAALFWILRDEV
jgi:transcriptional regulator with XRE-family HTH domain